MCSRATEKGQKALEEIRALGKPGTVELLQLNVADEKSIQSAAETVEQKHGR
jgi:NAD(P)-dependent dehydrogenase (short-subunit alcohol dehydrogenase family)